ncbi:uncharacterized protein BO97DRAFT_409809 [Aspergillus homomorphus CBS 101889]|uniref:Uncharacterized protein n=1 Tax=Aspergillus homomorphus (strain CBS 101889) TaxID=1450537 RepID=A0A395IGP4_ASPHC|nr:hypothetical protein BO97DRAFT_409809 [Aspergillus homomorphus CBS 101889]RAL17364.1 hypothetical protein BO97DRAFT_409809 [Aspergillus homomorphus CBS 101889]
MPSNKDRLYLTLNVRGGAPKMPGKEDTYHWALMVGPKIETEGSQGVRFHAKETIQPEGSQWRLEERPCGLLMTSMLLVRVMIAKIENRARLAEILRRTPIRQGQAGWNCVSWVKEALERLTAKWKVLGTNVVEWETVRHAAMDYCQQKKNQHRFDGQGNLI